MKRADALFAIRYAGYHGDQRAFMRLHVENRISFKAAKDEFDLGARQRRDGVRCTCPKCMQLAQMGLGCVE